PEPTTVAFAITVQIVRASTLDSIDERRDAVGEQRSIGDAAVTFAEHETMLRLVVRDERNALARVVATVEEDFISVTADAVTPDRNREGRLVLGRRLRHDEDP